MGTCTLVWCSYCRATPRYWTTKSVCPVHIDKFHGRVRSPTTATSRGLKPWAKRHYRIRKVKEPNVIETAVRRGTRNNGYIEIINDPSDEEDAVDNEVNDNMYRIAEHDIKLDFIQRIRE